MIEVAVFIEKAIPFLGDFFHYLKRLKYPKEKWALQIYFLVSFEILNWCPQWILNQTWLLTLTPNVMELILTSLYFKINNDEVFIRQPANTGNFSALQLQHAEKGHVDAACKDQNIRRGNLWRFEKRFFGKLYSLWRCQDISPRRHFTPGHLTPVHCTPWTYHPTDISPHGHFNPIWKVALIDTHDNITWWTIRYYR